MIDSLLLQFRPMAVGDLDAVHAIEVRSGPEPWSRGLLAGELDLPDSSHWLVVAGPEPQSIIVGFGGITVVADEAHLLNLAVDGEHRRRGIGARLLGRLMAAAVSRGAAVATLEVRPDNAAAIELYRRAGFRAVGRRRNYYQDGTDAMIMWHYALDQRADWQRGRS